jgi:serine/threonine-protein kinase
MGTVYLATDLRLARPVALKFIDSGRFSPGTADGQQRLLHEARAASGLNHPNICHVYDVGGEGADSWIAMEYLEGESLAARIRARGRLRVEQSVRIARQLAGALAHAHGRGILHRDLKSANIVCDADGRPKILDFGIARRLVDDVSTEVTRPDTGLSSSAIEGTLSYMAPEAIRGQPQDERSDLWSLGVVLHEMLTGALPFSGHNNFDLAAAIVQGPPVQVADHVPGPVAHIVRRLLARDPAERYATAAETAAALETLDSPARSPAPPVGRWRWKAAAALALAVAAVGVGWWRFGADNALGVAEQRLLSASAISHRAPSYSPDAAMVAFVAPDAAGVQQIWVQPVAQGPPTQITAGKSNANRPRWLPSGNQILYAVAGQGLWTVSPLGGTPTRVIERGSNPNVSRDGSRLVYEDQRAIWTAAPDGSNVQRVKGVPIPLYNLPMTPALSPDGRSIAYFSAELGPNGDFWTIPADGGTPARLTSDLREGGWPAWTADGRSIVVSSARAGSRTLWQIAIDGGAPTALTTGAGEDDQPELSRDGRHLVYTNVRNTWDLRVRDLATGNERSVLQRSLEVLFPMFSPDGQRLAYFGRSDYAVAIFTIGVDGSNPRQLTAGRELNHHPRWGHDGQTVYFFQNAPTVSFRRVPAPGGPSIEFKPWDWQTFAAPLFDPSGRFVAYLRQRALGAPTSISEHTVIHEVATGQERVWAEPHTHIGGWTADGASIVGWQHAEGGATNVVTCRVADETCRVLTRGGSPKPSPKGDRVYFVRPAGSAGSFDLWSIAADGTSEQRVAALGAFRSIDVFFDVSRTGLLTWAGLNAGQSQLWTAGIN